MIITNKRIYSCSTYTIGHLYADGKYICDILEDTDRMLDQSMDETEILNKKVKGKTAIPTGRYKITMRVQSPKFSKYAYYKTICKGYLPRLECVKGFSGVLIHVGNTHTDTDGCLLVGYNKIKGAVTDSRKAFEKLYNILKIADDIGQTIWLDVVRTYN